MKLIAALACLLILVSAVTYGEQKYTRGVGIYPGNPAEDYAPALVPDKSNYRNLALLRPAYHSSSYDYNLTAQLVTDGIKETKMPRWLITTLMTGVARKNERELLIDHNTNSNVNLGSQNGWIQFEFAGGDTPLEIDHIDLEARITPKAGAPQPQQQQSQASPGNWSCVVMGSDDGKEWSQVGRAEGAIPPAPAPMLFGPRGSLLKPSIILLAQTLRKRVYRIELKATTDGVWTVNEVAFFNKDQRVEPGGLFSFNSSWKPEGIGEEWVYVDLGSRSTFDRVALYWIRRAAEGVIQVSDDAKNWKDLQALPPGTDLKDDLKLRKPAQGRYVRALMKKPASPDGYILSELEVYGRGGLVAKPDPKNILPARADGGMNMASWRLQRDSLVQADGAALSKPGFQDSNWIPATVPATVLSSYWNAGALPDPNYGTNQLMISDSFFNADFWYRAEFTAPANLSGKKAWLNFDGINWKAEVFLNGENLGRIEGAFMRGRFDVTKQIKLQGKNALAIRIIRNATPGSMKQKVLETAGLNGGADNPADWVGLAQFINYDGYRAIFEAQGKNRMGVLLWMSHPCWPSFVWQTYDYYFDPTAGYFGSRKGSEPLHIQWNSSTDDIEVVNYNAGKVSGLTANVQLLNMDASVKWEKSAAVDSVEDSILTPLKMEFPEGLSPVHFIKLKLTQGEKLVSENFYWRGVEDGNYTALRSLPKVELQATTKSERQGKRWVLKTELNNSSKQPALMVRLKAVRTKSGDRILPAYYSDNFVSLMPGEQKTIVTRIEDADTRGESPRIMIDGFNIK